MKFLTDVETSVSVISAVKVLDNTGAVSRWTLRACRCFTRCAALCALGLAAMATTGWTQTEPPTDLTEASLEDLMNIKVETVYGASKHLQNVTQAPASITIVTSDEIRRYGYRTLADILRRVPGFYVTYDRNYTYVSVRGFGRTGDYNSRILLLVDGHRLNDDIYGEALLGTEFPIDVDLIERVEIIHGPSSSLYGDNAFLGVINVITKKGRGAKGFQVAGSGASYDTGYTRVTYGGKFKPGWDVLLSSSFYDSHGQERLFFQEFNTPETNNGVAVNSDHDKFSQGFADVSFKDLHLQAAYGTREKGIPTASFGDMFNDSRAQTTDRHAYIDLGYDHKFQWDLDFTGRIYFDNYTYQGIYPYSLQSGSPTILNYDFVNGAWAGEEVKLSKLLFARHLLTVGHEYRDNFRETQVNFDIDPYFLYLNDHRQSSVWALYAQDEYSIRKNLVLSAGVRHDDYYGFGGTTNPRVGLIYSPLAQTTLKFLYGSAFRAPNAYESYYLVSNSNLANPGLKPETIRTVEFVVEQYLGERYRLSGSVFQNQIRNLIDQEVLPNGFVQFQNADAVRAKGVELVFERQWKSGLSGQINYTYERATDLGTGAALPGTPAHLANANLLLPLSRDRGITAGLDLHYVSSRRTNTGNEAPGFAVVNFTLFKQRVFKGLELSGSVYNLLDARYGYPGGHEHVEDILYQDGRNARLKLTYTFGRRTK